MAQPASPSQPPRGVQVAFSGSSGNTMSDAGGFLLPSNAQPQTAQLRNGEADLKPQLVQLQGDEQYRVNIKEEDARGGHIKDHIAQRDADLLSQVGEFQTPSGTIVRVAEGTYGSEAEATYWTNRLLSESKDEVDRVVREKDTSDVNLEKRFGELTGREAFADSVAGMIIPRIRPTYGARIIITYAQNSPRGYRVHTSFPINILSN